MAWINLAAGRWECTEAAISVIKEFERAPRRSSLAIWTITYGLLSGRPGLVARALPLAHKLLRECYDVETNADLVSLELLPPIVALSVGAHLHGADQTRLWDRIAHARSPSDPPTKALKGVVARLLKPPALVPPPKAGPKRGHCHREAAWLKAVNGKEPTSRLFDLAASPDHPHFGVLYRPFLLPLGLLLHREMEAAGNAPSIFELFRLGSQPGRHQDVLFERTRERPKALSKPKPRAPDTWFGFDAVEVTDRTLRLYHYLGLRWQAPLLFDKELNAFRFLDSLDLSWRLLASELPATKWKRIEAMRAKGQFVHVVVHDDRLAPAFADHTARAAERYGVPLETCDVMRA